MVSGESTSDLAATASMLGSAKGTVGIGHSQLNATGRDHYNITNNYNYLPAGDGRLPGTNCFGEPEAERRVVKDENAQTAKNTAKQAKTKKGLSEGNINGPIPSQTPKQCAIYVRNLLNQGHGWPIYVPGPNKRLPKMYRRKGMRIGDVGIFKNRGSFEFFFNICHPANHRINRQGVPKNFKQLQIQPTDIQEHSEFNGPDSYISSSSIKNSSGLKFESSASEGAVLAMRVGAISEDVRNEAIFRKYASIHAEDWYRYINNIRGCGAKNGDVRLVSGYHKTSDWCIATFAESTAKQNPFFLEFNPVTETNVGKWKHSGTAEVRTGPGAQEIESLRKGDPDHKRKTYQNQSLFGRTISATLGEHIWNKLAAESEVEIDDDSIDGASPASESSNQGSIGSARTNSSTMPSTSASENVPGQRTALATIDNISIDPAMTLASVSHQETVMPYHPSDAINEMLLKFNPNARVAITSDNDWISVLRKDDFAFPSIKQLYSRIMASLVICQDGDVVFLEKPKPPTSSPCIKNNFQVEEGLRHISARKRRSFI
ncbi:hypothetical protein BYT27DRAFT_7341153 [Phlegmacium glaucopus]|nr:hypothetical protein BYT27DRAFT_7341153 [Phlegmacium glaucopus]